MHLRVHVDPDTFSSTLSLLSLKSPTSQDAEGILQAIKSALEEKGLDELWEKLVFLCTDGASVNRGLKSGLIKQIKDEIPWVAFMWCLSHRLELALKDALSNWKAMTNFVDKFCLYLAHFENIIADTTKRTDKATLEGKRREMCQADVLLFSALFMDILEPVIVLSLTTQKKDVNLIKSVNCIDNMKKTYEKLLNQFEKNSADVLNLPTVKRVLQKVECIDDETYRYQKINLKYFERAKQKLETEICDIIKSVH